MEELIKTLGICCEHYEEIDDVDRVLKYSEALRNVCAAWKDFNDTDEKIETNDTVVNCNVKLQSKVVAGSDGVHLYDYLDGIGVRLEVCKTPGCDWSASLNPALYFCSNEVFGEGDCPDGAIESLVDNIQGTTLLFKNQIGKTFKVPEGLYYSPTKS